MQVDRQKGTDRLAARWTDGPRTKKPREKQDYETDKPRPKDFDQECSSTLDGSAGQPSTDAGLHSFAAAVEMDQIKLQVPVQSVRPGDSWLGESFAHM